MDIFNADGEVQVNLADGWSLRTGVYTKEGEDPATSDFTSGEYVRLCRPDGTEALYWDQSEWAADPALVMGAILNSAAGLRFEDEIDDPNFYENTVENLNTSEDA